MRSVRASGALKRAIQSTCSEQSLRGGHAEASTAAARFVVEPAATAASKQRLPSSGPGLAHFLRLHDAQQAQQPDSSRAAQASQARERLSTHCMALEACLARRHTTCLILTLHYSDFTWYH